MRPPHELDFGPSKDCSVIPDDIEDGDKGGRSATIILFMGENSLRVLEPLRASNIVPRLRGSCIEVNCGIESGLGGSERSR